MFPKQLKKSREKNAERETAIELEEFPRSIFEISSNTW